MVQSPSFAPLLSRIRYHFHSSKDRSVSSRNSSKRSLYLSALLNVNVNVRRPWCCWMTGSFPIRGIDWTIQWIRILRLVDEKTKTKIIASFLAVPTRSVLDPSGLVLSSLSFYGLPRWLSSGTNFVLNKIFNVLRITAVNSHTVDLQSQKSWGTFNT